MMKFWQWLLVACCWLSAPCVLSQAQDVGNEQPDASPAPAREADAADRALSKAVEKQAAEVSQADDLRENAAGAKEPAAEKKKAAAKPARDVAKDDRVFGAGYKQAMVIDVQGPIFGGMRSYVLSRLESARRGNVDLIILRITSPGGSLDDSLTIAKKLSEIDWANTIAFVPSEAYSGAAIISLGCDRIVIRPRALIGDAGPIELVDGMFRHVEEKMVSAIAAEMHQLAVAKKRPGAMAEAMIDRKLVVYEATHKETGERAFLTEKETKDARKKETYDIGAAIPESGQNRFLTVSGERAVELMIAERVVESESELMASLQVDNVRSTRRTWVDDTVYVLNRPLVTGLLLLIALIGLYVEFSVPGASVPALVSLSCFGIFFWSHALGGTSGWLEVMLFALGVASLVIEIFVLPGFGVFGLTGIIMIVLSLVMASQDFVLPQSTIQWTTLRNNLLVVLGALAALAVAFIVQITMFDSIPGLGRLKLAAPDVDLPADAAASAAGPGSSSAVMDSLPQLGQQGIADSVLRPAGKVRFGGQLIDVVTEGDYLDPGTAVEVIKREGNRIIVRRA